MNGETYRAVRDYENLQKAAFPGVGQYNIPKIAPVYHLPDGLSWIGFNYVRGCREPKEHGVHFFIDDYQFIRVWRDADRYADRMAQFGAVLSPDFSPYSDFPKAVQIYNHYRKHWCAAYWQAHGALVVPTITWSDPSTFEWCFDGEPVGGVVALSSLGCVSDPEHRRWLVDGFYLMIEKLYPREILWRGTVPEELDGFKSIITPLPVFTARFDERRAQRGKNSKPDGIARREECPEQI